MATYKALDDFLHHLAHLSQMLVPSTRSAYLRCAATDDYDAFASALAPKIQETFSKPIYVFRCDGDFLRPGDGDLLVAPLLAGDIVLLLCHHHPLLASTFTDKWTDYLEGDAGVTISVVKHLDLPQQEDLRDPGFLFVVDATSSQFPFPKKSGGLLLSKEEIGALARTGKNATHHITGIGRLSRAAGLGLTMKDLCMLHERDLGGDPRLEIPATLNDQHLFTWTDLQALLLADMDNTPEVLNSLRSCGRIDEDKWSYGLGAYDYLIERKRQRPKAWPLNVFENIYDAVWYLDALPSQKFIFRGQSNAQWRLDSGLLRNSHGSSLDVQTLVTRVQKTEAFLSELRRRQYDLIGAQLRDIDLLAIAQHYGFATPLLDFTRSHRIAAFFATHSEQKSPSEKPCDSSQKEKRIGVIYYIRPERKGFGMTPQSGGTNIGTFSLLDAASIHLGTHYIIEPVLPEKENRIARQQGVFLAGYQAQDLQSIAIDRIYFLQQPGEVFEDRAAGITEQELLSNDSALDRLAKEVNKCFEKREEKMHHMMAETRVPTPRLIGSRGDMLYAQITQANDFFSALTELIEKGTPKDGSLTNALGKVFSQYFEDSRALTTVGELSGQTNIQQPLDPFQEALTQLALVCHVDEHWLRNAVADRLPNKSDLHRTMQFTQQIPSRKPDNTSDQIALACAYYLSGWEHLIHVEGHTARNLTLEALGILKGHFRHEESGE